MSKSTAISKRYPIFIDFFDKFVSRKQEEINKLKEMESLYLIAKEALEMYDYPNDININNHITSIQIDIILTEDNHYKDFLPLVSCITKLLSDKSLRNNEEPSIGQSDTFMYYWYWAVVNKNSNVANFKNIIVNLHIPMKGTKYYKITSRSETYTTTVYDGSWIDK